MNLVDELQGRAKWGGQGGPWHIEKARKKIGFRVKSKKFSKLLSKSCQKLENLNFFSKNFGSFFISTPYDGMSFFPTEGTIFIFLRGHPFWHAPARHCNPVTPLRLTVEGS